MDQNTGKGLDRDWDAFSLIGNERAKNSRIEGSRGSAKLSENRSAAEKAKAVMKSSRKELLGWDTRK